MKILKVIIFIIISSLFGANFDLDLLSLRNNKLNNSGRDNHDIHIIGIMVDFESDDDPKTTGDGQFLSESGSARERCVGDNFLVDPPPHNAAYFESQIEAVKNYYFNVSNENLDINFTMLQNTYSLENNMSYYSVSDETIGQLFSDALDVSKSDWELVVGINPTDDYLFVVFHAGVGQDISFPYFDPANYDIPSAYIEESMLASDWVNNNGIEEGIVMPETLNHIYYDIVEDLFYGVEDYCDYQLGMTGLFSLLVGYALDFPVLYNTENGRAGVGVFGLMDYGSNNGFGVIPAPPSPWTKINKGWASSISPSIGSNTLVTDNISTANIHRIDVANNEYLLVENRNNWVFPNTETEVDIDSLRRRNKITNSSGDEVSGHFFDVIRDNLASVGKMTIDSNTGVITGFDSYDYGLPGSGILIWEINDTFNESEFIDGINNDPNDKGIQIKEADGAMDIGFECYYWNPAVCDIIVRGMADDMWHSENEAYFINNENQSNLIFNDYTYPNSRSNLGALSSIQLDSFGEIGLFISYDYSLNPWVDIVKISDQDIVILGSYVAPWDTNDGDSVEEAMVYYKDGDDLYRKGYLSGQQGLGFNPDRVAMLWAPSGGISISDDSLIDGDPVYITDDAELQSVNSIGIFGYIDNASILKESSEGIALGDLDGDGLDEIVLVNNNSLDVQNSNGSSVDGFPISGNFDSTVLIANILNDDSPELVVRRDNVIDFIDSQGNLINSVASNSTQDLRLLPSWGDKAALIDGNRMLLFPYDSDNTFWTSKYGNDWNSKTVDQFAMHTAASLKSGQYRFYNYPNPVRDGGTTFRFLYNVDNMTPVIKLYDVQGTLKETIVPDASFTYQSDDYNEILADLSGYKAGVYFAELKDGESSVSIIKVAIIK